MRARKDLLFCVLTSRMTLISGSRRFDDDTSMRTFGLAATLIYAAFIGWLYVRQPQTLEQVTGGLTAAIGAYHVDEQAFADGLAFFRHDQFAEARMAFTRA